MNVSPLLEPASFRRFPRAELEQTIQHRFESQVAGQPGRTAVWTPAEELTYAELDARANAIAHALVAERGESWETVAVLLEHDAPLVGAILGVLKAGKAYVPLDPAYPRERLQRMLDDSTAALLVAEPRTAELASRLARGRPVVAIFENDGAPEPPRTSARPDDLAYVYYTSGTTGQPKGVADTHRNVLHNVMRYTNGLLISPDDRLTLLQRPAFSGAVSSLFGALLNGAAVCPFDVAAEGPARLAEWLAEGAITIYHSVPAVFRQVAAAGPELPSLRVIRLEGDRATFRDVELFRARFHDGCVLVNGLGATECGIVRRFFMDRATELPGLTVPVGYAVEDMEILLLDEGGREVAEGEVGEIAVRSRYLAPGYWRRPGLTAARFRPDPTGSGERVYLTGDLGRLLPGGCLEHLGRTDETVKVRGHRVEVAAVETALLADRAVREAAVAVVDDGEAPRIVAYVVPAAAAPPTVSALRRRLARTLPEWTIPSEYVFLEALPLNENGKVDLGGLPRPPRARPLLDEPFVAPRSLLEQQLAVIWEELLDVRPVGVRDAFEDLGGDSLLAAVLLTRLEEILGRRVPFSVLGGARTLAELATALLEGSAASDPPVLQLARGDPSKRPFVYVHGDYLGGALYCSRLAVELDGRPFYAVVPHGLGGGAVPLTIEAMAAERVADLRAALPSGPYLIGGHCQAGGVIALEMARLLESGGETVALVLIGTTPRNTRFPFRLLARAARAVVWGVGRAFGLDEERRVELFWRVRAGIRWLNPRAHEQATAVSAGWVRALLTYVPRPYRRRVTLLWPVEDPPGPRAAVRRWRRLGVRADASVVPGDHRTAVTTHVAALAAALRPLLDDAERDQESSATA
jgi:amino acid adenylation domain-containing protein